MNYRHAFHAGNFADVLKHAILALIIDYLKQKPAPFRVIDTHAGIGLYDLHAEQANKTGEWRDGIARVLAAARSTEVDAVLAPYFGALASHKVAGNLQTYPGSPLLSRHLLRTEDRLVANELHPEDAETLRQLFARDRQVKISTMDGWTALKAFLPPKERRGVVLIDPPFEVQGELDRMLDGVRDGVRRFATGTFVLWYPIKALAPVKAFERQLAAMNIPKMLCVELLIRAAVDPTRLNGTGLIIINPPFVLKDKLAILLPFLAHVLGREPSASAAFRWLSSQSPADNI